MVNEKVSYITKPYSFKKEDDIFKMQLIKNIIGGTPMVTVKRKALLNVGLFDESLPALEDYELWLRLAKNGKKFYLIEDALTENYYTTKKSSISKNINSNEKAIQIIENKYSNYYSNLDKKELEKYLEWKQKMFIHKWLLMGNRSKAAKSQLQLFINSPSIKYFLSAVIIIINPKLVFKLRAKLG